MRLIGFMILALVLATSALAQTNNQPQKFGTAMCRDRVPCPLEEGSTDFPYAATANTCVVDSFSIAAPNGYFEDMGLDSNKCLRLKPNAMTKANGRTQIAPQCCVVEQPDNTCRLHCELLTMP